MEEDIGIELQGGTHSAVGKVRRPVNCIPVGKTQNDDVKVYIRQDVLQSIERLAASNPAKEVGGVLLGDYGEEPGSIRVVISGFIKAKFTDASASSLTFTHLTWEDIHDEQDILYPGLKILGWQHTHPGYGIFLSGYDLFIQENFFQPAIPDRLRRGPGA